jgi:hypothetical protein
MVVLYRSAARRAKERAMRERASQGLEGALARLADQVAGGKLAHNWKINELEDALGLCA